MKCEYRQEQAAQPCHHEATHSLTVAVAPEYDGGDYCETHACELAAKLREKGFQLTVRELIKRRRAGA